MIRSYTIILLLLVIQATCVLAQSPFIQNYDQLMEIPEVVALEASSAHLYIMSESEGLVVFRSYKDSLQWLYTSSGMQQRGHTIMADIRFAYLFGNSRRFTVLEPTSALGVYSSTVLPDKPKAAARVGNRLYIALGSWGLGKLNLESPETVDSEVQKIELPGVTNASVLDVRSSITGRQLFVLTDQPALHIYDIPEDEPILSSSIELRNPLDHIYLDGEDVWGTDEKGNIYEINATGIDMRIGSIPEAIAELVVWNGRAFIRGISGRIWVMNNKQRPSLWKEDGSSGNYLVRSQGRMWLSENDKITEVLMETDKGNNQNREITAFKIKPISNRVLSYPEPLLLALEMQGGSQTGEVEFSYRSRADNAQIRENGFYWQPAVNQVGMNWFVIKASSADGKSDSTRFMVEVRSFNAPPRFSPVRTSSIVVNETYSVTFHAVDPENPENGLIRYLGVDLPKGSYLNEHTGEFKWKPDIRQVGETTFRVIATDKSGAASSMDISLRVLDISRGN